MVPTYLQQGSESQCEEKRQRKFLDNLLFQGIFEHRCHNIVTIFPQYSIATVSRSEGGIMELLKKTKLHG